MRKKTETAIKVLNNKIEEQRKLIDFLLQHDRNEVVFYQQMSFFGNCRELWAKYIYNCEIKCLKICGCTWGGDDCEICIVIANPNVQELIENTEEKFVVKVSNKDNLFKPIYYKVFKHNGKVADVTEYYKKAEPTTVANPDTPNETDFKYFTAEQVRNMSQKEVKENYADIMKSMKKW